MEPKSPYVDYSLRCQYAVECLQSITAPEEVQIIELETLWLESLEEEAGD